MHSPYKSYYFHIFMYASINAWSLPVIIASS